jgi:hypothetical protein
LLYGSIHIGAAGRAGRKLQGIELGRSAMQVET